MASGTLLVCGVRVRDLPVGHGTSESVCPYFVLRCARWLSRKTRPARCAATVLKQW
jgi:hypothetical protein